MKTVTQLYIFLLLIAYSWRRASSTCVLESDFGFTLNCQFRKSSMFRVRNLGGVKGYVGLGFSVGDELGFKQSLSNVEGNKRRSTNGRSTGLSAVPDDSINTVGNGRMYPGYTRTRSTQLTTIPPFRPIPPAASGTTGLKAVSIPVVAIQTNDTIRRYAAATVPQFHALPASITNLQASSANKAPQSFRNALQQATDNFQTQSMLSNSLTGSKLLHKSPSYSNAGPQVIKVVPETIDRSSVTQLKAPLPTAIPVPNSLPSDKPKTDFASLSLAPETIKTLSAASNLSEEAITAAIALKQQQLMQQQQPRTTSTTPKSAVVTEPSKKYPLAGPSRVMNAPKEYYPVGYDKNFDDNFVSRVELPDTTFYCGEQKHFPGLYADEDLGCMVFHVCAFTDDGLIMKSFLCPESTLFDQSILKCNWWFYVDCKASKKLYDSNIPVSKSYQLMKALSFFSAYNKER